LCEAYWLPLYAFARRRGYDSETARELTQSFFTALLDRPASLRPNRERRFRSYLLGAFKHYLANDWDRTQTRKRGGGESPLRLDFESGEKSYRFDPADPRTPETLFEHRWALAVLEAALLRLEKEYERRGKSGLYERLKPFLSGEGRRGGYATLGRELSMAEGAVKVAAHRLRRRYRELLRAVVAETVETSSQVDEELRHLLAVVSA
jgi:RNA polymerase sigma-70 factor (ECF subfamily)